MLLVVVVEVGIEVGFPTLGIWLGLPLVDREYLPPLAALFIPHGGENVPSHLGASTETPLRPFHTRRAPNS